MLEELSLVQRNDWCLPEMAKVHTSFTKVEVGTRV